MDFPPLSLNAGTNERDQVGEKGDHGNKRVWRVSEGKHGGELLTCRRMPCFARSTGMKHLQRSRIRIMSSDRLGCQLVVRVGEEEEVWG